jgi:hypothetical protein
MDPGFAAPRRPGMTKWDLNVCIAPLGAISPKPRDAADGVLIRSGGNPADPPRGPAPPLPLWVVYL